MCVFRPQWPWTGPPMGVAPSHKGKIQVGVKNVDGKSLSCGATDRACIRTHRATMALHRSTNRYSACPHGKCVTVRTKNVDQLARGGAVPRILSIPSGSKAHTGIRGFCPHGLHAKPTSGHSPGNVARANRPIPHRHWMS